MKSHALFAAVAIASLFPVATTQAQDSDSDGLSDAQEMTLGTDPMNPDTDADGIQDGVEVLALGTDPLVKDTDVDGLPDGIEPGTTTDPLDPDTDSGTVGDGEEDIVDGSDPTTGRDDLPDRFDEEAFQGPEGMVVARLVLLTYLPRVLRTLPETFPLSSRSLRDLEQAWARLDVAIRLFEAGAEKEIRGPLTSLMESDLQSIFGALSSAGFAIDPIRDRVFLAIRNFLTFWFWMYDCVTHLKYIHTLDFSEKNRIGPEQGGSVQAADTIQGTPVINGEFRPLAWIDSLHSRQNARDAAVLLVWWTPRNRSAKVPGQTRRIRVTMSEITCWPGVAINTGHRDSPDGTEPDMQAHDPLNNRRLVLDPGGTKVDRVEDAYYWERIEDPVSQWFGGAQVYKQKLTSKPVGPGLGTYEDENTLKLRINCYDWGASCIVGARAYGVARRCKPAPDVRLPVDSDLDLLPDFYEIEKLGEKGAGGALAEYGKTSLGAARLDRLGQGAVRFLTADPGRADSFIDGVYDSLIDLDPAPAALPLPLGDDRLGPSWGVMGDGLTCFEEYRGVYTIPQENRLPAIPLDPVSIRADVNWRSARYVALDPWTKDMFLELQQPVNWSDANETLWPEDVPTPVMEPRELVNRVLDFDTLAEFYPFRVHRIEGKYLVQPAGGSEGRPDRAANANRGALELFLLHFRNWRWDRDRQPPYEGRPDIREWQRTVKVLIVPSFDKKDQVGHTDEESWAGAIRTAAHRDFYDQFGADASGQNVTPNEAGPSRVSIARVHGFRLALYATLKQPDDGWPGEKRKGLRKALNEGGAVDVVLRNGAYRREGVPLTFDEAGDLIDDAVDLLVEHRAAELEKLIERFGTDEMTIEQARLVVLHEIGHALGLAELLPSHWIPEHEELVGYWGSRPTAFRGWLVAKELGGFDPEQHPSYYGITVMQGVPNTGGCDLLRYYTLFALVLDELRAAGTALGRRPELRLLGNWGSRVEWNPKRGYNDIDNIEMRLHFRHQAGIENLTGEGRR